jgi:non-reducing end alpha-L-arabinofuranosidase
MKQEGGIILGIGGDNSNWDAGSFFEGVMTAGFPTDTTDNVVQSNIVAVGYGAASAVTSGTLAAGSTISLQATTASDAGYSIQNQSGTAMMASITSSSSAQAMGDATWIVRPGLADSTCVSFVSRDNPGAFLRHFSFVLLMQPFDGTATNRGDATFCSQPGKNGKGYSFASKNYSDRFIRQYQGAVDLASNGTPTDTYDDNPAWDTTTGWTDDVSFTVAPPWAP